MSDLQNDSGRSFDEDVDDGPVYEVGRRSLSRLARNLVIAAIGIAAVAFIGLVWFAYNQGVRNGAEEAAPVLRADNTPVKRKPDDPGGMEIPDRDKLVYDRIAPGQARQPVERLLPPPEKPVERPTPPPAGNVVAADDQDVSGSNDGTMAQPVRGAVDAAATEASKAPAPAVSPPPPPAAEPDPPRAEAAALPAPEPPAPEPTAEPAASGTAAAVPSASKPAAVPTAPAWRIQLASLGSEARAREEWARMQKANADLLGALALQIEQAKLSKGTYYRIQAGPLADRAAAGTLCGKLKARKQDCLVVAP